MQSSNPFQPISQEKSGRVLKAYRESRVIYASFDQSRIERGVVKALVNLFSPLDAFLVMLRNGAVTLKQDARSLTAVPAAPIVREAIAKEKMLVGLIGERIPPNDPSRKLGAGLIVVAPLVAGRTVLGAVGMLFRRPEDFKTGDGEIVGIIAEQAALSLEKTRRFRVAERALDQSTLLLKAAENLTESLDFKGILSRLCETATQLTGLSRCMVFLYNPVSRLVSFAAGTGGAGPPAGTRISVNGLSERHKKMYTEGDMQVFADFVKEVPEAKMRAEITGTRSVLGIPLKFRDEVLGGLYLDTPWASRDFTERQIEMASGIAHFASIAISNSRTFEQTFRKAKISEATAEIARMLGEARDVGSVLNLVVTKMCEAISADCGCLFYLSDGMLSGQASYHLPQEAVKSLVFPVEKLPIANQAILTLSPAVEDDVESNPDRAGLLGRVFGIKSMISLPLATRGKPIGDICISFLRERHRFSRTEIDFEAGIALHAASAIENACLLSDARRSAEERERAKKDLEVLNTLALDVSAGLDLADVLSKAAKGAAALVGAERAGITLYAEPWKGRVYGYRFTPQATEELATERVMKEPMSTETVIVNDYPNSPLALKSLVREGVKRAIIVPLKLRGRFIGTLGAAASGDRRPFEPDDAALLESLARQAVIAIENATFYERERSIAETLQESLLTPLPVVEGLSISARYEPAVESARVGGDFYDLVQLGEGLVALVIGDISGKGLEAATMTSMAKNVIRAYAYEDPSPSSVLERVNRAVFQQTEPMVFVTVFYGLLDVAGGRLTYSNAGHTPPILLTPGRLPEVLKTGSLPVGVFADREYPTYMTELESGSRLIMYTDGLSEARSGKELFGEKRLLEAVSGLSQRAVPELVDSLMKRAKAFAGGKLTDDIAIVAILRK